VWEGLGTALESFTPRSDGSYVLGDRSALRFRKAQDDILGGGPYVILVEMLTMGSQRFRAQADIISHYAQAMAWTMYFLLHDGGSDRDTFLAYTRDAYRGRFRAGGAGAPRLLDRLGRPAAEVEAEFRVYLQDKDDAMGAAGPP
jgi:hypothetical protein